MKSSPKLIEPRAGSFTLLDGVLLNALGEEQKTYFDGWVRAALKALYAYQPRVGQALVLIGQGDSGKSLLQNLISLLLEGRSADPYRQFRRHIDQHVHVIRHNMPFFNPTFFILSQSVKYLAKVFPHYSI